MRCYGSFERSPIRTLATLRLQHGSLGVCSVSSHAPDRNTSCAGSSRLQQKLLGGAFKLSGSLPSRKLHNVAQVIYLTYNVQIQPKH